jgi:hypothetical protein
MIGLRNGPDQQTKFFKAATSSACVGAFGFLISATPSMATQGPFYCIDTPLATA